MSTNALAEDLLKSDVQDPSDFPPLSLAPGLRQLDDALRCSICREFYDAPVTLACGHCYCSLCIRSVLPDKPECPSCRQSASEVYLRKNPALESVVKAWSSAREFILRLSKEEQRRLTSPSSARHVHDEEQTNSRKRKRGRSLSTSSGNEVQIVCGPSKHFVDTHQETETVLCPACQQDVPLDRINQHLDSKCRLLTFKLSSSSAPSNSKGKQKEQWSKLLDGGGPSSPSRKGKQRERAKSEDVEPEYLPKVNYDVLSKQMLHDRLAEHGLPTTGDLAARIRRHTKWVMLWNANVDHAPTDRKNADQLRRELRRWEDEQRTKRQTVSDTVAYQKANKAEFRHLVETARPKRSLTMGQEGDVSETSTAHSVDEDALDGNAS